jgi:hypothetical protein
MGSTGGVLCNAPQCIAGRATLHGCRHLHLLQVVRAEGAVGGVWRGGPLPTITLILGGTLWAHCGSSSSKKAAGAARQSVISKALLHIKSSYAATSSQERQLEGAKQGR